MISRRGENSDWTWIDPGTFRSYSYMLVAPRTCNELHGAFEFHCKQLRTPGACRNPSVCKSAAVYALGPQSHP